jgi:hypothetical protein
MKKTKKSKACDLRPEYRREDLGKGVRGKYHAAYQKGSNLVLLRPEIAKAFPTSEAVNKALQSLLQLTEQTRKLARPARAARPKSTKDKSTAKSRPTPP